MNCKAQMKLCQKKILYNCFYIQNIVHKNYKTEQKLNGEALIIS